MSKTHHPFLKDPQTGQVYPNQAMFQGRGFLGCYTISGETDLTKVSESDLARTFPNGVPARIKSLDEEVRQKAVASASEKTSALELSLPEVTRNLEKYFAEGAITRDYLLALAGGVPQEQLVEIQTQVEALTKEIHAEKEALAKNPTPVVETKEDSKELVTEVEETEEEEAARKRSESAQKAAATRAANKAAKESAAKKEDNTVTDGTLAEFDV